MRKIFAGSLVVLLTVFGSQAFAQKKDLVKQGVRALTAKPRGVKPGLRAQQLVPAMRGVYIPSGTTMIGLEQAIERTAHAAGMDVNARMLASNPAKLREFEQNAGIHVFGEPALSGEKGLKVLQDNYAKFAHLRSENTYEKAWREFQADKGYEADPFREGKTYADVRALALDVYNFHIQKLHTTDAPKVRLVGGNSAPHTVYEIPVNGLRMLVYDRAANITRAVSPDNFVVLANLIGDVRLLSRASLEAVEDGEPVVFEVLE